MHSNNIESNCVQFQFLDQYESNLYNNIELEEEEENDSSENYSIQIHSEKPSIENDLDIVEDERYQEVNDIPLQFGFMHSESDFINAIIDNDFTSDEEDISKYYRNEEKPILEDIYMKNDIKFEECSICLIKLDENDHIKQTMCRHIFHGKCIQKWFETSGKCPLCRSKC